METFASNTGLNIDSFRLRLKQARTASGLTQRALADLMGVSAVCICKWEIGDNFPRSVGLAKLASVLGTSITYLCSGVDLPPDNQSGDSSVRTDHLRHMTRLARHMIAEAASVPLESVSIRIDKPERARDRLRRRHTQDGALRVADKTGHATPYRSTNVNGSKS